MFVKGQPRPVNAGRKKGTPNKKRVPLVSEYLASRNINPAAEILKLIPTMDSAQKYQAWKTLLSHSQPPQKAIEPLTSPSASPSVPEVEFSDAQLLSLVKGRSTKPEQPNEQSPTKSTEGGSKE